MNRFEYMDRPLELLREVPLQMVARTSDGAKEIVSTVYPFQEAKVIRARRMA